MLEMLYIALPAFVANILPVVATRWNILSSFNITIHADSFGPNKTWRGLVLGIFGSCIIAMLQYSFHAPYMRNFYFALLFGFLSGAGALGGDLLKSFFKRACGIASGRPFIPFDQIDYMLGFLFCTYPLLAWNYLEMIFLVSFALFANPLVNCMSYLAGIKKTFW